ncbi:MAG: putative ATPase, partial [Chthonomonadales bacterium]|nr:putative ATPase [Chthonomonadales bacterium]
ESAYTDALQQLLIYAEGEADFTQALDYALRIVALDPTAEDAHVAVIRLFHKAGRPREALRQYDTLERTLHSQLNAVPARESRTLADSIRTTMTRPVTVRRGHRQVPTLPLGRTVTPAPRREVIEPPPSLPVPLLPFFGREAEIERIKALLHRGARVSSVLRDPSPPAVRLLTLLGPGGSGKTRLAIEVASQLHRAFAGAVWFVSLAELSEAGMVPEAILDVMGLSRRGEAPWFSALQQALGERSGLLILDNFEHLVEDGAQSVRDLLTHLPGLICVTTSRLKLDIEGERVFVVAPLPVPKQERVAPAALLEFPSVQLFVERAQAARMDFQITERNAATVAELTRRLEGLPLAIELAAAWAQMLTPAQMLERLENRFQMLVSRRRDPVPRHRSLHAAIASSYALLSTEAQRLFCRLAVFRGGFDLDTVVKVCGALEAEGPLADRLEDLLLILQKHSLLEVEEWEETLRFTMLESLREFAWEQLNPMEAYALALAHASWCRRLVQSAGEAEPKDWPVWVPVLIREQANWRAALEFCFQSLSAFNHEETEEANAHRLELGVMVSINLNWYWQWRGAYSEGRGWLERALVHAKDDPADSQATQIRYFLSVYAYYQGEVGTAKSLCQTALDQRVEGGKPTLTIDLHNMLGLVYMAQLDYSHAELTLLEALRLARETGVPHLIQRPLSNLGLLANRSGNYAQARLYLEETLAINRELEDTLQIANALGNLANVARNQGDLAKAKSYMQETLNLKRTLGDRRGLANALSGLSEISHLHDDLRLALTCMQESLALRKEMQDRRGLSVSLTVLGEIMADRDVLRAVRFYAAAQTLFERFDLPPPPSVRQTMDAFLDRTRSSEPGFEVAWNMGRVLSPDAAVEEALDFCSTGSSASPGT